MSEFEIWKDVQGYEGYYQVSNFGRVKSLTRTVKSNKGDNYPYATLSEKIRKPSEGKYLQIILCKDGKTKKHLIHRLVAQAFIPNPNNLPCVNHKDENPRNNHVENLEWCTYQYNNQYNNRVERCRHKISTTLKQRQYHHKMSPEQIEHIRQDARKGWITRRNKSAITSKEEVVE